MKFSLLFDLLFILFDYHSKRDMVLKKSFMKKGLLGTLPPDSLSTVKQRPPLVSQSNKVFRSIINESGVLA